MSLTRLLYDCCGSESDAREDRISELRERLDCALCDLGMWQARAWGETNPVWLDQGQADAEVYRHEREVEDIERQLKEVGAK